MTSRKSKKYFKLIAVLIIVCMLSSSLTVFAEGGDTDPDRAGSGSADSYGYVKPKKGPAKLVFTITTPKLNFEQDQEGYDLIKLAGYNNFGLPGEPFLPYKVFNYALPPEFSFSGLTVKILDIQTEVLEGTYSIKPAVADMTETGIVAEIANTQDNEAEAHSWVSLLPPGQMRKWKFARLEFNPILFDPESGEITVAREVTVEFNYDLSSKAAKASLLADNAMDAEARELFDNYKSAKSWYQTTTDQAGDLPSGGSPSRLVIITTNAIELNSTKIVEFYWHKWANKGLDPIFITEDEYGVLTGQAPNGTAEKIRQWLIENYVTWGITHVLLIGDPDPDDPSSGVDSVGDVPMKMMWPRRGIDSDDESPTDYFYADLNGNWDLDGDSYFGEWTGDYYGVVGGVDFAPEVYVGRIPVYDADYATLDSILQKIMDYEMEVNPTWRNTALLPMSFGHPGPPLYDGAPLAEQMIDDYLDPSGYSSWTMYQQGSGACGLDSIYASDQELRGGTGVRDRWAGIDYGTVVWWGHGNSTQAAVGYDGCWDGLLMSSTYATSLDDDHPAFVYLNSCTNGYPESSTNLGYALLKNGAIGTVSASRVSWFNRYVLYGDFDGSTTNSGIGYEFARRINDYEEPAGYALYKAKSSMTPEWESRLMNFYDFNLYGDPTTSIADHAPPKVIINEVDVGVSDKAELYNYGSTAVNLTGWILRAYRTSGTTELTTFTLPSFWLPAGGYVVLHEGSGVNTATDLYFNDQIYWYGGNSGSAILYDSEWVGVDFVKWDDDASHAPGGTGWVGPNPPYPPTNDGVQLGRDPNGVDTNYGSDWCLQKPSQGSENKGCVGDDVGFYVPDQLKWYLKNNQTNGWTDFVAFNFGGPSGSLAVSGDWNNDGIDTVGFYVPSQGKWYLKNNQINGWNDYLTFNFAGPTGSIPVAGDWNNDGWDTVGFYVPSQGKWYLKNNHLSGWTNYVAFNFAGPTGSQPVAGDWDADGVETVGFYVPSQGKWYLKNNQISGWTFFVTVNFAGATGSLAVAGDWDGDGEGTIGFYVPSQGKWYLKNNLLNGWFNYVAFNFAGPTGSQPVAGDWE